MKIKSAHKNGNYYTLWIWIFVFCFSCGPSSPGTPGETGKQIPAESSQKIKFKQLLVQARSTLSKPGLTLKQTDTLTVEITNAEHISSKFGNDGRAQLLVLKSMLARKQGKIAEGKLLAETAVTLVKKSADPILTGQCWYELAEYYDFDFLNATLYRRIDCLLNAAAAFEKGKDFIHLAECYKWLADMHHYLGKNEQALNEIRISLRCSQIAGDSNLQRTYTIMAKIYNAQDDLKQALKYGLLALETGERMRDTATMCQINNNLGYIYFKLSDNPNALKYFTRSSDLAKLTNDNQTVQMLATNIVAVYIKMGKPLLASSFFSAALKAYPVHHDHKYQAGNYAIDKAYFMIYMSLKNYDKAGYYCRQLLTIAKDPELNKYILSSCYANAIEYFITVKDYQSAAIYLEKNHITLTKLKDDVNLAKNYAAWVRLDSAKNDFHSAYAHLKEFKRINDSIFSAEKTRQVQQLNVQFQSDKKEHALKDKDQKISLLLQNQQLQATNLKKSSVIVYATLGAIVLLLIISGLFYRQFKQKQRASESAVKNSELVATQNQLLNSLLQEKEWLLKEVHHRVKNNLQIVMGLLSSQAVYLENSEALEALTESQNRVHAIALIHQKLYNTESVSTLHMPSYVKDLVNNLSDCFNTAGRQIKFECLIAPIALNLIQAVPFGLILNEAVTNSIKYAFPEGGGNIAIELRQIDNHNVVLQIADNGIGLPAGFNIHEATSLGIELMKGLSKQLGGTFELQNNAGVIITVQFQVEEIGQHKAGSAQSGTPG